MVWCLCGWSEKLETAAIKVAEDGLWRNESTHAAAAQPGEMLEIVDIAVVFKLQYTEWRLSPTIHPPPSASRWRV